ncbi:alpha-tubulin N-acetyltransferase-like [Planococcus citri]|uniref:alpha-tubulin N-acetyltransferase-like n=1 Tax=Planococcus citri TaxID=170843 RepID=UPI0031FA4366
MEFKFKLSDFLMDEVSVIQNNLLPVDFTGSVDEKRLCIATVGHILDKMGEASGRAQNLRTPVTSALKFANSDQIIYLMVNLNANNCDGNVIGFLKMGWKNLFIFDLAGMYIQKRCFCCLDFYIHESKQRQGYGKQLFDFMLKDNSVTVNLIPIDRPSEKLLKFLQKHYHLSTIVPQPNNFIVYEQFFNDQI